MIISNISIQTTSKKVTLSADITFRGDKPKRMYFTTDVSHKKFIQTDASPFLAAVLLPCMKTQEDIFVEGEVSAKLVRNIEKIFTLFESWNVGLQRVCVQVQKTKKDTAKAVSNGLFFSAGVDSFYTYLKHKKNSPSKITHFLLIHGFDIELTNVDLFKRVEERIQTIAEEENIDTISVETNAAQIIEPKLVWNWGHGGALASVALFLRSGMKNIFISSSLSQAEMFPYGTHPDLDKLWATEKLSIVHDGTEYSRTEKIVHSIAKSPLALRHIRVCCQNLRNKYNCSACFKCLGTMISFEAVDALKKCKTFTYPLNLEAVRSMYYDFHYNYDLIAKRNLRALQGKEDKAELVEAILYSLHKSKRFSLKRKIRDFIAYIDQTYNKRRMYQFVFMLNKQQDRNIIFKLLNAYGMIK